MYGVGMSEKTLRLIYTAEIAMLDLHTEERALLRMRFQRTGGFWGGPLADGSVEAQARVVEQCRARFADARIDAMAALEIERTARQKAYEQSEHWRAQQLEERLDDQST